MSQHSKSHKRTKSGQLDRELACLFGKRIVTMSQNLTPADLMAEAELVAEGARQLKECNSQPEAQRRIVSNMAEETAAALCKWIREPELAGRYLKMTA